MLELYKADLQDLLLVKEHPSSNKEAPKLSIKRDDKGVIRVDNIVTLNINSKEEMGEALRSGHRMRKTAATKMNSESSRSHLVTTYTIYIC